MDLNLFIWYRLIFFYYLGIRQLFVGNSLYIAQLLRLGCDIPHQVFTSWLTSQSWLPNDRHTKTCMASPIKDLLHQTRANRNSIKVYKQQKVVMFKGNLNLWNLISMLDLLFLDILIVHLGSKIKDYTYILIAIICNICPMIMNVTPSSSEHAKSIMSLIYLFLTIRNRRIIQCWV